MLGSPLPRCALRWIQNCFRQLKPLQRELKARRRGLNSLPVHPAQAGLGWGVAANSFTRNGLREFGIDPSELTLYLRQDRNAEKQP